MSSRCIPVGGVHLGRFGSLDCPVRLVVGRRLFGRFGSLDFPVRLVVGRRLSGRFGTLDCLVRFVVGRRLFGRCVLLSAFWGERKRLRQPAHPCPKNGQCERYVQVGGQCFL